MSDSFSAAAVRLCSSFLEDGPEPLPGDHERVRGALQVFLLARFPALGADELLDVVDETITRLVQTSREAAEPLEHPAAWLFTVASRETIDRLRRQRSDAFDEEQPLEAEDELARLIDRDASRAVIEGAFARAYARADHTVVRIAKAWLDMAETIGGEPSSRVLAEDVGYSHTTINEGLARFRGYVAEELGR
jgi:Sigma-70 region 2